MLKPALAELIARRDLSREAMAAAMGVILEGAATGAQIGAFAAALRMKGVAEEELLGAAEAMRARAARIEPRSARVLDTCGTGGDGAGTFNVSTAVAFVAAGAGAVVAKHGNRAVSSRCGSADVLAALGLPLELPHAVVRDCIDEVGLGFLYAPAHHGALRHAASARREIGFHSVFNLLGPLTNPAGARYQLLGTFDGGRVAQTARVLARLGAVRAWVVHGRDGLDELSPCGPSDVAELGADGVVRELVVEPEDAGVERVSLAALAGGDAAANARVLEELLSGGGGALREAVVLNAAAALVVAELAGDLREGAARARAAIDGGAARAKLDALRARLAGG